MPEPSGHFKDEILDRIARRANVAQFVSFGPDREPRYSRLRGTSPNHRFESPRQAVEALLERCPDRQVNIRSYEPHAPKSREFLYGLTDPEAIVAELDRLAAAGLTTIVNETVDIHDGGVSGVAFGNVVEFAPGDTPRCVEKPGTASLPRRLGLDLLETVYGFRPDLPDDAGLRVEFSIHPLRRGFRHRQTIIWELETTGTPPPAPRLAWPNRFSRFLGDKLFGLLVADRLGLPVPRTHVVARHVAPFAFGTGTGLAETWIRTCPTEQVAGKFTTARGWRDPFRLLQEEDPGGDAIASILAQEGVDAAYSGALVTGDEAPLVEGVRGWGEAFMAGRRAPEPLPEAVRSAVLDLYGHAAAELGAVRFEWVWDGTTAWVVQLHRGAWAATDQVIHAGEARRWHRFEVSRGLEALRELVGRLEGSGEGIVLVGRVGITSHLGDILRRAGIPSRLETPEE